MELFNRGKEWPNRFYREKQGLKQKYLKRRRSNFLIQSGIGLHPLVYGTVSSLHSDLIFFGYKIKTFIFDM